MEGIPLPKSEWMHIFAEYLPWHDVFKCKQVCKSWCASCEDPDLWRLITVCNFGLPTTAETNWQATFFRFHKSVNDLRASCSAVEVKGQDTRSHSLFWVPHTNFLSLFSDSGSPVTPMTAQELSKFLDCRFGLSSPKIEALVREDELTDLHKVNQGNPLLHLRFFPEEEEEIIKTLPHVLIKTVWFSKPIYYEEEFSAIVWLLTRTYFARFSTTKITRSFPTIMPSGYF